MTTPFVNHSSLFNILMIFGPLQLKSFRPILMIAPWLAFGLLIDDKLFPSITAIALAQGDEATETAASPVYEGLALLEDAFNKSSHGKNFFGGDRIGYLDIALGCSLGWVRVVEKMKNVKLFDEEKTPSLWKWTQDFCAHLAVKDLIPDIDKQSEFANMVMTTNMKATTRK